MSIEVVTALAKVGRPPILEYFGRRSCIASTRIGLDVLAYFGVQAEPLPLFMLVLNGEAINLAATGMSQAELRAEMNKYGLDEPGGPWGIGVGAEIENSKDWAGHLMIAVPNLRVLLDMSFDQASRPHKDLSFPDEGQVFAAFDDAWWGGERSRTSFTGQVRDGSRVGLILDRDCADPEGYRRSANWRRQGRNNGRGVFREVTGRIIRLVKDELASNLKPEEAR